MVRTVRYRYHSGLDIPRAFFFINFLTERKGERSYSPLGVAIENLEFRVKLIKVPWLHSERGAFFLFLVPARQPDSRDQVRAGW